MELTNGCQGSFIYVYSEGRGSRYLLSWIFHALEFTDKNKVWMWMRNGVRGAFLVAESQIILFFLPVL
jgi:hypothetical protein